MTPAMTPATHDVVLGTSPLLPDAVIGHDAFAAFACAAALATALWLRYLARLGSPWTPQRSLPFDAAAERVLRWPAFVAPCLAVIAGLGRDSVAMLAGLFVVGALGCLALLRASEPSVETGPIETTDPAGASAAGGTEDAGRIVTLPGRHRGDAVRRTGPGRRRAA